MSKFDQKMEEVFNVSSSETESLPEIIREPVLHESLDEDLKSDYEVARGNFHELIEKGKEAIDDILTIARESEKGRDFEVAATLLKNVIEANEKMIDLHKKIREISNYKPNNSSSGDTNIKNAVFVIC